MKNIKLIQNDSEIAAGTRGASLGTEAMKVAAYKRFNPLFQRFPLTIVAHENNILTQEPSTPNAKYAAQLVNVYKNTVESIVNNFKSEDDFLFVLSGDHGSAGGTMAGLSKAYPNKKMGVIWIDAHADIHSPYTTPSGNMHGMPLATALARDNKENQINQLSDEETKLWEELKSLGAQQPILKPENLIYFGVRDTETPEEEIIERLNIRRFNVEELRYRGFEAVIADAEKHFEDCDVLYVSFDVDSMDCHLVSHGTGTPVAKGFDRTEALDILTYFTKHPKTKIVEFVEINPTLDEKGNEMAETAFELLNNLIETLEK